MYTLVLNLSYEPIRLIHWEKAVVLFFSGKVEIVSYYNHPLRSMSLNMEIPAVVRNMKYHKVGDRIDLTRSNIYARDSYTCQYCNTKLDEKLLTIDHIIPKSRGGQTTWQNLVTSCQTCNFGKANRTPTEAGIKLIRKPTKPTWIPALLIATMNRKQIPEQWLPWISNKTTKETKKNEY